MEGGGEEVFVTLTIVLVFVTLKPAMLEPLVSRFARHWGMGELEVPEQWQQHFSEY